MDIPPQKGKVQERTKVSVDIKEAQKTLRVMARKKKNGASHTPA